MITVISPFEKAMSKAAQKRLWEQFMRSGTNHSKMACTLTFIIRKCELEKVPYVLQAWPGKGYFIKPGEKL